MKKKLTRTPEGIPSYILKEIAYAILFPLSFIFNSSLQHHWVPDQWKTSFVVPIFKNGDRSKPLNYRPISLTSSFSRLFESILHQQISTHLEQNSLISKHQYGFLRNRTSCEQLLTCMYQWLCTLYKNNGTVNVLYTDIKKAFDTVSHRKLINMLDSYGLNHNVICWFKEFLNKRTQSVCIGSSISNSLPVHSGVPQGSVIGPLIFLLYFNGVATPAASSNATTQIRLFADDAKLFDENPFNLQLSLDNFVTWLDNHQLQIAPNKCFSISIPKVTPPLTPPSFNIGNHILEYNPLIKDLGVYISDDLKWESHISKISRKAALKSYQILKCFKTRNVWLLKNLFCTYVRPLLEHNTPVWSPYLQKDIVQIETVQKRFTKAIFRRCGIPFSSYKDRLYKLNMESLERRRVVYDLILLYKIINGISYIKFSDYFKFKSSSYNLRRNSLQIISNTQLKCTNHLWRNNFFNKSSVIWNELPERIVKSSNLNIFKTRLRGHVLVDRFTAF